MTHLNTQRLLLRNLSHQDLPILFAIRSNSACAKYQRWDATSKVAISKLISAHETDLSQLLHLNKDTPFPSPVAAVSATSLYFITKLTIALHWASPSHLSSRKRATLTKFYLRSWIPFVSFPLQKNLWHLSIRITPPVKHCFANWVLLLNATPKAFTQIYIHYN